MVRYNTARRIEPDPIYRAGDGAIFSNPAVSLPAAQTFESLADAYVAEVVNHSSPDEMRHGMAFQRLVSLGSPVIPWVLSRLSARGMEAQAWLTILPDVAGVDPVQEAHMGVTQQMVSDWLGWGAQNGLIRY